VPRRVARTVLRGPRRSNAPGLPDNSVHYVRDVTFDEDRSQTRTGTSAQVMATFRNVAISLHRLAGATTIAQATRAITRRPERVLTLIS